jgi:glycosyltransferase involved in cell wall biosynthesis
VLAHNAEAAVLALLARRALGVPIIYIAHTLFGEELHVYGPPALAGFARSFGRGLDRRIARRADGIVALSERARKTLAQWSPAPAVFIPPGLAPGTPPAADEVAKVCAAHDLEAGAFALYAGNLDAYQDVDDLIAVATHAPEVPVVLATHTDASERPGVRVLAHCDTQSVRALSFGARLALCPRRTCAGFPIKLLNYMEAGRAIVAREGAAGTLTHGRDAWLVPADAGASSFAEALRQLYHDSELRAELGAAARRTLETRHAWPALAAETLALVETTRA